VETAFIAERRGIVVGSTRIVLIEEVPLIERLASLFERPENETASSDNKGRRVCEAHILGPNLILLDLTRACADPTGRRQPRKATADSDAQILTFAKQQPGDWIAEVAASSVEQPADSHSGAGDGLPATEPTIDSSPSEQAEPNLQIGPVRIDRHGHWAYLNDKKLHLTPTEFRLLECFLREPGRAFTRSQLLDVSIGNSDLVLERTIDVHIRSLRAKLGASRELVETVRGIGYRFRESHDLQ
jgi:two-component system, OmpR family, phosphate regulon response regulator PhoB